MTLIKLQSETFTPKTYREYLTYTNYLMELLGNEATSSLIEKFKIDLTKL